MPGGSLWQDECGQEFIEYTLLLAMIVMLAVVGFEYNREAVAEIVSATNSNLHKAINLF